MLRRTLLSMIVCLWPALAVVAEADERQDAARMEQLLAQIQKVVPPGWEADFELVDPRHLTRGGRHPALEIRSCAPLPVEHLSGVNLVGRAPGEPEPPPEIHPQIVPIRLVAYPYMSPQSHAKARAENKQRIQKRIDFERDQLRNVEGGFMGPAPIPPNFYDPKTKDEKNLVMQYSFLWTATEPRPLPTHHTDDLSIDMLYFPLESTKIHDDQKAKEYQRILDAVQKIIVAYETDDQ